jgi:Protein of unknown function (DUF3754)
VLQVAFAFQNPAPLSRCSKCTCLSAKADGADGQNSNKGSTFGNSNSVCRVVASSDGKLPSLRSALPPMFDEPPYLLDKLDLIYHALSHEETRKLEYLDKKETSDPDEEKRLISVLRTSLEDAGFQRLMQRDLDLCEALNAGYLLRLSIQPDVSDLDPSLAAEMHPELLTKNGTRTSDLLVDGRVLVYRRGYSSEKTKGRLLLPKLDYLQASLVQESAFKLTQQLGKVERAIAKQVARTIRSIRVRTKATLEFVAGMLRPKSLALFARNKWGWRKLTVTELKHEIRKTNEKENKLFKFGRYGGSKVRFGGAPNIMNALSPFLICLTEGQDDENEPNGSHIVDNATHDIYQNLNRGAYTCQYDAEHPDQHHKGPKPSTLLERVNIGNVVDVFSSIGRRRMLRNFLSKVELVEPTYEEVVVIWRPLGKKPKAEIQERIPKAVYDMAEIFDVEHKLPNKSTSKTKQRPQPLEIRAFTGVPMANLPAVFPKTRLIFRPADAFLFDFISVLTFVLVLSSQRFDNPKLDLFAFISVSLWLFRTVIRYSNKLARYDLLVKTFLTSKIAHRDGGAVKYVSNEAASQRATRAALLHSWLSKGSVRSFSREQLIEEAFIGVNEMLANDQYVDIDVRAGLKDLQALGLITFSTDGSHLMEVADDNSAVDILKSTWSSVFDGKPVGMASLRNQTFVQQM